MPKQTYWQGSLPPMCDFCHQEITTVFVDGRTTSGPWGIMCLPDHLMHGVGLGLGKGQKYAKTEGGNLWVKVGG